MSKEDQPPTALEGDELLASALHAHLLQRRRATLEHDIKNVVHGLLSGTELLAKALSTNSARITPNECLGLLQQQLSRAQTTLSRMLEEVAPSELRPTDVELADLINECTHALRHQLQSFALQTSLDGASKVRVRASRFKDVLMLILWGCVDRSPPRTRLELTTTTSNARAVLTINHTLKDQVVSLADWTSLQELLTADDMRLDVSTNGQQRTIEISLPATMPTRKVGEAVVIVDGNRDAADSLAMLTQLEGFDATPTYDAESTLTTVKAHTPLAVLVDLDGSIDGIALLRKLRREAPQARLIGLSYSHANHDGDADAYLGKPLDISALRNALKIAP